MENFNKVRESFRALKGEIFPMWDNKIGEEDFRRLIGAVEVVPSCYEGDFLRARDEKNYFEVVKFYMPIAYPQFCKLLKNGQIYEHSDTIFCRAKYDSELGLFVDEFETNILE